MAICQTSLKAAAQKKTKSTKASFRLALKSACLWPLGLLDTHSRLGGISAQTPFPELGVIAQLGERLHGMQEVGGSIPPGSTNSFTLSSGKLV